MERCETPASRSLSSSALGSAAIASLAPAAMAKALVCFPPSLDPADAADRSTHGTWPPDRLRGRGWRRKDLGLALGPALPICGSYRGARPQPGTAPHRRRDPWGAPPQFCAARTPHAP